MPARRPARRSRLPRTLAQRLALIDRLYRAIDAKLKQLEASMASSDAPSATDHERETRALGTLIRNVEKVADIETDLRRGSDDAARRDDSGDVGALDASRLRRELAERIRSVRERAAASGA
jgi:hypothetical protein